jgi:hypothetical protein
MKWKRKKLLNEWMESTFLNKLYLKEIYSQFGVINSGIAQANYR